MLNFATKEVLFDLGHIQFPIRIPDDTRVLRMGKANLLSNPEEEIRSALNAPISCPPLNEIVKRKLATKPHAQAVIVISDHTRPVPYKGKSGILYPVVDEMLKAGLKPSQIRLLIATGTHRSMSEKELRAVLDPRIFSLKLQIVNHDCLSSTGLVSIGRTEWGGDILLNRLYVESDIKVVTGLVESHFMAGASGGRKAICPGLLAQDSTYILHGGSILSSPSARDLVLDGNPVHREALRVAKMAGCDLAVNVTIDADYKLTGIYAGDLEKTHLEAVKMLKSYAAIKTQEKFDVVLTHAGYVGINHYQAAKGATICAPILQENGRCILAAFHTDSDPIGGSNYKKMMRLLGKVGPEEFCRMILDPSWEFVPEQWEAQMWTRLFNVIPPKNLIYCSLEIPENAFSWLPETDARSLIHDPKSLAELVEKSLYWAIKEESARLKKTPRVAVLPDGPYGIPVVPR